MRLSPLPLMILHEGLDDWVSVDDLNWMARFAGIPDNEVIPEALAALSHLADLGLIEIGTVSSSGGFVPTTDVERALGLARTVWMGGDRNEWGWVIWSNNTEAGDQTARAIAEG